MTEDDFQTMKVIGRGGFGRVLLVRKKDTGRVRCPHALQLSVERRVIVSNLGVCDEGAQEVGDCCAW